MTTKIIPIGWRQMKAKEVAQISAGGTPSTKNSKYWGENIPWMNSGDLNKRIIFDVDGRITALGLAFSSAKIVPINSVLIGLAGQGKTRGTVAVNKIPLTTNQSVAFFIPEKVHYKYLFFDLYRRYDELRGMSAGDGGRGGLNLQILKNLNLLLPPLPEQEKIVEVLEAWDKYLEKLDITIILKRKLKNGLMQVLLTGKMRLQGFKDKWTTIRLRDACDVKGEYGINAASVDYNENLPTYLRITDIDENGYFISSKKKSVNNKDYKKFILAKGDIVFARTGATVGKSYLYNPNDGELVFAGFLIRFRLKKAILLPYFLKAYTDTKPYWNWVKTNSSRSGQPGINSVEYGQLQLNIPSFPEQTAIANILTTADQEIEALEKKRELIEAQKKFLLNNLVTGKIRLQEFINAI